MNAVLGARLALLAAALPILGALVAVRPADAAPAAGADSGAAPGRGYQTYSLTALASGARTGGVVGVTGGLATLDTGSAQVSARLDSAPSAAVLAAPYEPGTLFRTAVGQVNAGASQAVLDVPDAEAQFPGAQTSGELVTVPAVVAGPVASRGGAARAAASARSASGSATGQSLEVTGIVEVHASTSQVSLTVDPVSGLAVATGRTTVGRVVVAGVLVLRDIEATASIQAAGSVHTPVAALVVGSASVAGQQVVVSDQGVTAVGTTLVPGQSLQDATDRANAVLTAAGVTVRTVGTTRSADARSATADTGGVAVSVVTAPAPGGAGGDRFDVIVGGVVLTGVDAVLAPPTLVVPVVPVDPRAGTAPPHGNGPGSTIFVPGTPGTPAVPGTVGSAVTAGPEPVVALPTTLPASVTVAGRQVSAVVALAAFAVWQFLSLGTATLYAVVERRRRIGLALR